MLSEKIIHKTLVYWNKHKDKNFVVKPSIPILYFGDLNAYKKSQIKILTVGKNPSDNEFKKKKSSSLSFFRFPKWDPLSNNLEEALNEYFYQQPLKQWFSSFEPILNGLNASYYANKNFNNSVIHTDICTPLATDPTWSKLTPNEQDILFQDGFDLWSELIDELKPDLILVSIPKKLYDKIPLVKEETLLISFDKRKDGKDRVELYNIYINLITLSSDNKAVKIIYGQPSQTPFGSISNEQKMEAGRSILKAQSNNKL